MGSADKTACFPIRPIFFPRFPTRSVGGTAGDLGAFFEGDGLLG
jgi:hypothetical protein